MNKVQLETKIKELKDSLSTLREEQFAKIDLMNEKKDTIHNLKVDGATFKKRTAEVAALDEEINLIKKKRNEIKQELTPLVKKHETLVDVKPKRTSVRSFVEAKSHLASNSADEYSLDLEGFTINANYSGFYALKSALEAEVEKTKFSQEQITKFRSAGEHWRYEVNSPKEVLLKETFKQLRFLFERKKNTEWAVSSKEASLEVDAGEFGVLVHPKRMRSLSQNGLDQGKYRFSLIDELIEFDGKSFNNIVESILYLASQSFRNEAIKQRRKYQDN